MNNPPFRVFRMTPDQVQEVSTQEFLSLAIKDIPRIVTQYVAAMEVERTNEWCKCEWIIHPDDVDIPKDICGVCGHGLELFFADIDDLLFEQKFCHAFGTTEWSKKDSVQCGHTECKPKPRRMRRGDQDPMCPVHTKEGFILGFFDWAFRDAS